MGTHPIFESDFDCLTDFQTKNCIFGRCLTPETTTTTTQKHPYFQYLFYLSIYIICEIAEHTHNCDSIICLKHYFQTKYRQNVISSHNLKISLSFRTTTTTKIA